MKIEVEDYLIPLQGLDLYRIIASWTWLTGDKIIVALTKNGDALLSDQNKHLYFLETGGGTIEQQSYNYQDLMDNQLDPELTMEILLAPVVDQMDQKIGLKPGQVYSYTLLPVLGGKYDPSNRYALDIYEHYGVTGDLHMQLKDTPDGTWVDVIVK